VETANRRLIRPNLNEVKEPLPTRRSNGNGTSVGTGSSNKRTTPPDQTNAENFYYVKQMQSRTPMVFVLSDGEVLEGCIEWYDKCCLKITREDGPNLLVYKPSIKYMYKAEGS
jgi:host factor-I protein